MLNVAIIGAGFGGLSAAIDLKRAGVLGFEVFERATDIGGTWRDNTYPGCACDIPSHLYSFSHTPNRQWTCRYPSQPEIQAYLQTVADSHQLRGQVNLGLELVAAQFDDHHWLLTFRNPTGIEVERRARFLVTALGPLNKPLLPNLPGLPDFAGPQFHSMHWRHDVDLRGKRVAVVGTGASAIQFVPEIAKVAASVSIFQRTPPWVLPRGDAPYGPVRRWLNAHLPGLQLANRWRIFWRNELLTLNFLGNRTAQSLAKWAALAHLRAKLPRDLQAKVQPNYQPGCKRVLVSDAYYPALRLPTVAVHTSPIVQVGANTLHTADGAAHPADVLIFGTGFKVTEFVRPLAIRNPALPVGQQDLADRWQHEPAKTWFGLMVHGYPNAFLVGGPNTGLGSNSIVFMIEAQTRAIARIIQRVQAQPKATVEPTHEAQENWYASVQQRMGKTVWASGCNSWYQSADGKIDTLWPSFVTQYWWQTRRFDWSSLTIK